MNSGKVGVQKSTSVEVIDLSSSSSDSEVVEVEDNSDDGIVEVDPDNDSSSCQQSVSTNSSTDSYPEIERLANSELSSGGTTEDILETPSVIPRKPPDEGNVVYGQGKSALHKWSEGVVHALREDIFSNTVEFDVRFNIPRVRNGGHCIEYRQVFRQLPCNLLAYHVATPFKLPVGSRVIAKFHNPLEANGQQFFVGIIAEPIKFNRNNASGAIFRDIISFKTFPNHESARYIFKVHKDKNRCPYNHSKYLIFFDDGSAQYVKHKHVRLVYGSSPKVWEDVYPDSQSFVQDYLLKYPEVPLIAVSLNSIITAEWNGIPWPAKVLEVDNSLTKLQFECTNHTEWIYRGSKRLLKYQTKKMNTSNETQYSVLNSEIFGEIKKYHNPIISSVRSCIEYEGKLEPINFPCSEVNNKQCDIVHLCTQRCVPRFSYKDFLTVPPMAIPLFLGFKRVIDDRSVYYKGPCGKIFRNYAYLHQYLLRTNSNLGIDLFSLDKSVRCSSTFVPKTAHYKIKDMSHGVNIVPIECVNSLGMDMPGYFEYSNSRLPQAGVEINYDEDFLACCDCVDDCEDQEKCSCWQLTLSGSAFSNHNPSPSVIPPRGYENRRLYDFIVSGIYECNKRCRCRSTCLNKVVQIPSRIPMQIFKTANKGWAIRPLSDLPFGSFICTYGGQLLTESKANEDGKRFGDEYLAQIDYIEIAEFHKFGYEEEVSPDVSDVESDIVEESPCSSKTANLEEVTIGTNFTTHMGLNTSFTKVRRKTRQLFGKDEQIYVMDAKSVGNIGRYLNHSCEPNVFVQNVLVDSHDIRFPWVAFFASRTIKAGTELTWNYNYTIDSVPGKKLYCHCGTPRCKGRLL